MSVKIGRSDDTSQEFNELMSMLKNISIIDFNECEQHLIDINYIKKDDVIVFIKTDWSPTLASNITNNGNMTKSSSITYGLYFENGTKIDMDLCANTTTNIKVKLNNLGDLNMTKYDEMLKQGYDIYDKNSPYYNSLCIPMKINDSALTIQDRRD